MKLRLIVLGKTEGNWLIQGCEQYQRRLRHYYPFETEVIPDIRVKGKISKEALRKKEAEAVLARLSAEDRLVLLDEKGVSLSSKEMAAFIEKESLQGYKQLVFLIAGAFGADEVLKSRAFLSLSLSKMTFPHQLVRLIFLEQLYRAMSIIRNEPYHNEG
jgi:23S rRNA (pseudouridine1915-N3)-methyltransferase